MYMYFQSQNPDSASNFPTYTVSGNETEGGVNEGTGAVGQAEGYCNLFIID